MKNFLTITNSFKNWSQNRRKCDKIRGEISTLKSNVEQLNFSSVSVSQENNQYFPTLDNLTKLGLQIDEAKSKKNSLVQEIESVKGKYYALELAEKKRKKLITNIIICAVIAAVILYFFVL